MILGVKARTTSIGINYLTDQGAWIVDGDLVIVYNYTSNYATLAVQTRVSIDPFTPTISQITVRVYSTYTNTWSAQKELL